MNTGVTDLEIRALAIHPATPTVVYAGTDGGGVFKTVNSGASWSAVNSGLTDLNLKTLAINPVTPATILSGAQVQRVTLPLPPHANRPFSVVENLRLQGIRRPFHLHGSVKERYAMAGNGIPVELMQAVCGAVTGAQKLCGLEKNFSKKVVVIR